jgi:hypothetical protein
MPTVRAAFGPRKPGSRRAWVTKGVVGVIAVNSLASIEDAVASGKQVLNGLLRIRNDERFEPATYC